MFVATVINFLNFLVFSLNDGNHVAGFIVFTRKALMDIDYPLSEKPELINERRTYYIVTLWAVILPVSSYPSLRIPCLT
jgi:hypothetical protein